MDNEAAWDELPDYKEAEIDFSRQRSLRSRIRLDYCIYVVLAILTNFFTFEITRYLYTPGSIASVSQHAHTSLTPKKTFYADIDTSLHREVLSGFSFNGSRWTAPASPEVDAEWDALGVAYEIFLIPEALAPDFEISPDNVLIPASAPGNHWGAGYAANIEALHQLHCVNLLRKALFFNHDYYAARAAAFSASATANPDFHKEPAAPFTDEPYAVRAHVNHCVDALRERIMCAADTRVSLYHWADDKGRTTPDFKRPRMCADFDSVRKFVQERQLILTDRSYHFETPEGVRFGSEVE